jgi:hypothetical protein
MIVESLSMPAALNKKTQANPAPKGQWETAAIFRNRALKRRSANLFSKESRTYQSKLVACIV